MAKTRPRNQPGAEYTHGYGEKFLDNANQGGQGNKVEDEALPSSKMQTYISELFRM